MHIQEWVLVSMEMIRSFVAIELDAGIQEALGQLERRLKQAPLGRLGRWVAPECIHLTLKFLGDVPAERVPEIAQAIKMASAGTAPFEIAVAGLGCFPNATRARVIWVGIEEPSGALASLQAALERELARLGFKPEGRGFTPHLTLARVRDMAQNHERAELGAWVKQQNVGTLATMRVREVSLMQSVLQPAGAIYTRLSASPLPLQPREG